MKKSLITILGLSLVVGGAFMAKPNQMVATNAASDDATYVYANFTNDAIVEETYAGWTRANNVTYCPDVGGSSIKVSSAARSGVNDRFFLGNLEDSFDNLGSRLSDDVNYAGIVEATGTDVANNISIIYTTSYISKVQNIHLEFAGETGHLFVLYRTRDMAEGKWTVIKTTEGGDAFAVASTTNVDTEGVWSGNYQSFHWSYENVLNASEAQIAILHRTYSVPSSHSLQMKKFVVNVDKAAVSYMDYLATKSWCGSSKTTNLDNNKLDYFNSKLTTAHLESLRNTALSSSFAGKSTLTNYYEFLEYVYENAGKTLTNPLSSNHNFGIVNREDNTLIIALSISALLVLGAGFAYFKKKRA